MIAGHFGFAAGVESIDNVPGTSGGYGKAIIHADYTHSLVGALALAALFGLVAARPWGRRAGIVLGAVVFSHWLLDLVVHRGDMPILPGNAGDLPRLGFGLGKVPAASIMVELVLVVAGAWLYWRAAVQTLPAQPKRANLVGLLVLAAGVVTLALDALVAQPHHQRPVVTAWLRPRPVSGPDCQLVRQGRRPWTLPGRGGTPAVHGCPG